MSWYSLSSHKRTTLCKHYSICMRARNELNAQVYMYRP
jgi:hypothetical protein